MGLHGVSWGIISLLGRVLGHIWHQPEITPISSPNINYASKVSPVISHQ